MLNSLFGDAFADPETYTAEPPTEPYLKSLLSKEHVAVLAAMAGQEVVGGPVAYELEKFERARSEFYLRSRREFEASAERYCDLPDQVLAGDCRSTERVGHLRSSRLW
jgi:hypothetical protein